MIQNMALAIFAAVTGNICSWKGKCEPTQSCACKDPPQAYSKILALACVM